MISKEVRAGNLSVSGPFIWCNCQCGQVLKAKMIPSKAKSGFKPKNAALHVYIATSALSAIRFEPSLW
jgi:hypothetical protein